MPRSARELPGDVVYRVLDRAVARLAIFEQDGDYAAFVKVFVEAHQRQEAARAKGDAGRIDVLAWCLMPDHWHLVLRPELGGELSTFMRWLTMTHAQRWHARRRSAGTGPLYQGRFKSFPVEGDGPHLPTVAAYVGRNPVRAGLAERPDDWPWSSVRARSAGVGAHGPPLLPPSSWPGRHAYDTASWLEEVARPQSAADEAAVASSLRRGRPFGGDAWTTRVAGRLALTHTLRGRGRPPKAAT